MISLEKHLWSSNFWFYHLREMIRAHAFCLGQNAFFQGPLPSWIQFRGPYSVTQLRPWFVLSHLILNTTLWLLLWSLYRWGNWGSETLYNLLPFTDQDSWRSWIRIWWSNLEPMVLMSLVLEQYVCTCPEFHWKFYGVLRTVAPCPRSPGAILCFLTLFPLCLHQLRLSWQNNTTDWGA